MRKGTLWFYLCVTWEAVLGFKTLFKLYTLRLKEVRKEGENIKTFVFSPNKKLKHQAGQYGLWWMPKWIWGKPARLFTIAASPTEATIQVSTRISDSDFKQKLSKLKVGSKVYLFGPIGRFTLGKNPPKEAVLIAGGIGATPMRAISRYVYDSKTSTKLTLIHSTDGYYLYQKEFEKYVPECHFVTKQSFEKTLKEVSQRADAQTPFYISGPSGFVVYATNTLKQLGRRNILRDGFLGY